jgi:hypothetical protein
MNGKLWHPRFQKSPKHWRKRAVAGDCIIPFVTGCAIIPNMLTALFPFYQQIPSHQMERIVESPEMGKLKRRRL